MFEGKGLWVWHADTVIARMGTQNVQQIAQQAKSAGIRHVIVKIADGADPYPIPSSDQGGAKEAQTAELIGALKAEGITVGGWSFLYGEPDPFEPQAVHF